MDSERFDAITRTLSSRRTALGGLLGGGLAAVLGLAVPEEAAAHNPLPGCDKFPTAKKRKACRRRAQRHIRQRHTCRPQAPADTCAGRCGTWADNCGKAVTCSLCPSGKACLYNGSCAQSCTSGVPSCPSGCLCGAVATEGGNHCMQGNPQCEEITQRCTSTVECPVGQRCQHTGCLGPNQNRCVPLCSS